MARVNLHFLHREPQNLGSITVHYERITAFLAIGKKAVCYQDCIIDLGAILPMFPEFNWRQFENEVSWICRPGKCTHLPDWLGCVTGLGAKSVPCGIGRIQIQVIELPAMSRTSTKEIIAKFPLDNGTYARNLLGLGGNVFNDWELRFNYAKQQAWLEF